MVSLLLKFWQSFPGVNSTKLKIGWSIFISVTLGKVAKLIRE